MKKMKTTPLPVVDRRLATTSVSALENESPWNQLTKRTKRLDDYQPKKRKKTMIVHYVRRRMLPSPPRPPRRLPVSECGHATKTTTIAT